MLNNLSFRQALICQKIVPHNNIALNLYCRYKNLLRLRPHSSSKWRLNINNLSRPRDNKRGCLPPCFPKNYSRTHIDDHRIPCCNIFINKNDLHEQEEPRQYGQHEAFYKHLKGRRVIAVFIQMIDRLIAGKSNPPIFIMAADRPQGTPHIFGAAIKKEKPEHLTDRIINFAMFFRARNPGGKNIAL